ncbi:MAG: T9SS type A sorting domain-containing protein [Bacteroidetes bacterium]|nr:T9SS type A sorting domain-containing protein [Bacteroidota bacterium]
MRKIILFFTLISGLHHLAYSQGEKLTGKIYSNAAITAFLKQNPDFNFNRDGKTFANNLRAVGDTIDIPFVDDFTYNSIFPDRKLWANAYVYVNDHFAVNPPSYGYATFDNLSWNGQPYVPINVLSKGASDTLMSRGIRVPKDTATYLSFFIQPKGLDLDPLDSWDSISLYFYGKDSLWRSVWSLNGKGLPVKFNQYFVKLDTSLYAHAGFRFMFINFGSQTGNANHWHLDYVELNVKRNRLDTLKDLAIINSEKSLLKDYYQLPWKQYKAISTNALIDSVYMTIHNHFGNALNVKYNFLYKDAKKITLATNSNTNTNILPKKDSTLSFITNKTLINSQTPNNDTVIMNTEWNYFLVNDVNTKNNVYSHQQLFANYIAQDDGTAEAGYGLEFVKSGRVANKFTMHAADSLWAIGIFFNQSNSDVRNKSFKLAIWSYLKTGTDNDSLIKVIDVKQPVYIETMNGFAHFILDTPIWLEAKDYYIGWIQNSDFLLNVGVDLNYALKNNNKPNPGVYYNVQKKWIQTFTNTGALMIRPYLGKKMDIPLILGLEEESGQYSTKENFELYPNPTNGLVRISNSNLFDVAIFDLAGNAVAEYKATLSFDLSAQANGTYFVRLTNTSSNQVSYKKIVKIN